MSKKQKRVRQKLRKEKLGVYPSAPNAKRFKKKGGDKGPAEKEKKRKKKTRKNLATRLRKKQ